MRMSPSRIQTFFFYLALDPHQADDAIKTTDPDMVCSHHQFGAPEQFAVPFLWEVHPDNFVTREILRSLLYHVPDILTTASSCVFYGKRDAGSRSRTSHD